MKVIDAFWEKRNLGVDAVSFHIGPEDTLEEILPIIDETDVEYQTAIIDPNKLNIALELQKHGFKFIESTLYLSAPIDEIRIPPNLERFQSSMTYRPATEKEINEIVESVKNGNIFNTDKIALDPFFGIKKSGIRYSFWIKDLVKSGKTCFVITYKDEVIGFEVSDIEDGVVMGYIGGRLPSKTGRMLGAAIYVPKTTYWKTHNAKKINVVVSSNNIPIIKIHQSFGLTVDLCKYVLIKHIIKD